MENAPHEITKLLQDWSSGDSTALDRLIPLVYYQLHRLANQHMRREKGGHLLQTALINDQLLHLIIQTSRTSLKLVSTAERKTISPWSMLKARRCVSALAQRKLDIKRAVELAAEIASGLSAAHREGVIHRDIKPENLVVTASGTIKILDFGLAKLVEKGGAAPTNPNSTPKKKAFHLPVRPILETI